MDAPMTMEPVTIAPPPNNGFEFLIVRGARSVESRKSQMHAGARGDRMSSVISLIFG